MYVYPEKGNFIKALRIEQYYCVYVVLQSPISEMNKLNHQYQRKEYFLVKYGFLVSVVFTIQL